MTFNILLFLLLLLLPHSVNLTVHAFYETLNDLDPFDDFILKNSHPVLQRLIDDLFSRRLSNCCKSVDNEVIIYGLV
jgi:hypothetical protein